MLGVSGLKKGGRFLINDPCVPKFECILQIGTIWEALVHQNNWY